MCSVNVPCKIPFKLFVLLFDKGIQPFVIFDLTWIYMKFKTFKIHGLLLCPEIYFTLLLLLLLLLWLFWSIHDHIVTPNISKYKIWTFDFVLQNTLLLCCIGNYYQLCVDCKSLSFWTGQLEYTFESWSVKVHCFFHLAYYEIFPYPHAQKFFFQESENLCQRIPILKKN